MILSLAEDRWIELIPYLMHDPLRNYFNLLGILSSRPVHEAIFVQYSDGQISAVIFKRRTGTLKFYAKDIFDAKEISDFIRGLEFNYLIAPASICRFLDQDLFSSRKEISFLATLDPERYKRTNICFEGIRLLNTSDLNEVVMIYSQAFNSHASLDAMKKRLETGRGRAFGNFINGEIASVVQTDFETKDKVLMVGLATAPQMQRKGLAAELLTYVIDILLSEGKVISIEYENLVAGEWYHKLGFRIVDSTVECRKK